MRAPTLEQPPITNGHATARSSPPRPRRAPRPLVMLVCAVLGGAVSAAILLATGTIGGSTKETSVIEGGVITSGGSRSPLNARAVYKTTAAGAVDVTANGVTSGQSSPFAPQGQSQASGSGSVIDAQGHILTAAHVVDGASSVSVAFQGGQTRSAKVLGVDDSTDVAVLSVDPSGLTLHPLTLGHSSALAVGDPLAVIGDPYQYERSLSTGVVSALDRTIQAPNGFSVAHAIQTDAAMNPGNSGGPVLDASGRLVGVADQIATGGSGSDTNTGVGFAVPIDVATAELTQLEHGGQVSHAYLGVSTGEAADQQGALVESVVAGGPAAAAGLHAGDVVSSINGTPVQGSSDLVAAIARLRAGDRLTLSVQRGSGHVSLTVTLGAQPRQAPTG